MIRHTGGMPGRRNLIVGNVNREGNQSSLILSSQVISIAMADPGQTP